VASADVSNPVKVGLLVGALLLNVVQSVDDKYPLALVVATDMLILGYVALPDLTNGLVTNTELTTPASTVADIELISSACDAAFDCNTTICPCNNPIALL
jgi:hypothetical protein